MLGHYRMALLAGIQRHGLVEIGMALSRKYVSRGWALGVSNAQPGTLSLSLLPADSQIPL